MYETPFRQTSMRRLSLDVDPHLRRHMTLVHDYRLPSRELFAVMRDPVYLAARQQRFGGVGQPTVTESETQTVIATARQLPLDEVPAAARPFVGDGRVTQVDTWQLPVAGDDSFTGRWGADLGSAPATLGGALALVGTEMGSQLSIGVEVVVNVPFIGPKLATNVAKYLNELIQQEQQFLANWPSTR